MPIPLAIAAPLIGQGINAVSQLLTNRSQKKYAQSAYAQQRKDSLADYTMQNEYNSPQKQMERLKMAGLNPNLAYGSVNTTSAPIRSTDAKSYSPQAPQIDTSSIQSGLMNQYDIDIKKEQANNLRTQNTVQIQDALLKAAQILATNQGTKKSAFDLSMAESLKENSLQVAQANLKNIQANTQTTLDSNERAAAMQAPTLLKAAEDVLTMRMNRTKTIVEKEQIRQQIENLKTDNRIKNLDENLKQIGVQPGDNILLRMLAQILDGLNPIKGMKEGIKKLFK
jgi:hypothetical protein